MVIQLSLLASVHEMESLANAICVGDGKYCYITPERNWISYFLYVYIYLAWKGVADEELSAIKEKTLIKPRTPPAQAPSRWEIINSYLNFLSSYR